MILVFAIISIPIAMFGSFVQWDAGRSIGSLFCIWLQDLISTSIAEELLFRGILLNALAKVTQRDWLALVISSIVYGLSYWQSSQMPIFQLYLFLYAFSTGFIFGLSFLKTRKIIASAVVHSILDTTLAVFVQFPTSLPLPLQFS
jgi:membrane protease YdiL (CAAX protease family)